MKGRPPSLPILLLPSPSPPVPPLFPLPLRSPGSLCLITGLLSRGHLEQPFTGMPPAVLQNFSSYSSRPRPQGASRTIRPIPEADMPPPHRTLTDSHLEVTHDELPWWRRTPPPRPSAAWEEKLSQTGLGESSFSSRTAPRYIPEAPMGNPGGRGEDPMMLGMAQMTAMSHKDLVARLVQVQPPGPAMVGGCLEEARAARVVTLGSHTACTPSKRSTPRKAASTTAACVTQGALSQEQTLRVHAQRMLRTYSQLYAPPTTASLAPQSAISDHRRTRQPSPGLGASSLAGGASIVTGGRRAASLSPRSRPEPGPPVKDVWAGSGHLTARKGIQSITGDGVSAFGGAHSMLRTAQAARGAAAGGPMRAKRAGEEEFVSFLSTFERVIRDLSTRHAPPRSPYI